MANPLILTEEEFRKAAKASTEPVEAQLRKAFIAEVKAADDDSRTIDFVLSTDAVDRSGDVIMQDGWSLANYKKNPVILFCHDASSLPVAKASNIRVEDGKLKATAEFMPREISGLADAVYQAYLGGFMSAVSVGFAPTKYAFSEDTGRTYGIDYLRQELLEFSCVPVPCNPEALIEMRSAGIDTKAFAEWAEKMVEFGGKSVISAERLASILALPAKFRETAKKLPAAAKGASGQLLRCANIAEKAIKGTESDPAEDPNEIDPAAVTEPADPADPAPIDEPTEEQVKTTPKLDMARRRMALLAKK